MLKINEIRGRVRKNHPLIHCITNPISINGCANAILAVGARPIMAEHPMETAQITESAAALVLNLGNITDARMESMKLSLETAVRLKIPVILDAVGVSCSDLRRSYAQSLLETGIPTVIKGNYSEINALRHCGYRSSGVDADGELTGAAVASASAELARRYGTVILASGKTDLITDGKQLVRMMVGTPRLTQITGTGCMLGALCGAYLSAEPGMDGAVTACAVLGICGQMADTEKGSGTFAVNLMDTLSVLTDGDVEQYLKMEETKLEAN